VPVVHGNCGIPVQASNGLSVIDGLLVQACCRQYASNMATLVYSSEVLYRTDVCILYTMLCQRVIVVNCRTVRESTVDCD